MNEIRFFIIRRFLKFTDFELTIKQAKKFGVREKDLVLRKVFVNNFSRKGDKRKYKTFSNICEDAGVH